MMEPTGEMSSEQIGAIRHSVRIGSLLVNDHPEIAELYGDGMSYPGIAESLDVKGNYGASDEVARSSIYHAITGHAGGFSTEPYDGLIQDLDKLTRLKHEHNAENGRRSAESINPETGLRYVVENGRRLAAEGKGVHGYNPETGERYAVEGGIKLAAEGKGVHGLTPEQRLENGRKALLARGLTPWEKEETEYAHLLSLEPEYKRGSQVNNKEIAQVLNEDYHNGKEVRNAMAVQLHLSRYIKTLEN